MNISAEQARSFLKDVRRDLGIKRSSSSRVNLNSMKDYIRYQELGAKKDREDGSNGTSEEAFEEELEKRISETVTPPDDPFYEGEIDIMDYLVRRFRVVIPLAGLALPPEPLYGIMPLQSLNAMALQVPRSSSYVVAFHEGVFQFIHIFCMLLAHLLYRNAKQGNVITFIESTEVESALLSKPDIRAGFGLLLDRYIFQGDLPLAVSLTPEELSEIMRLKRPDADMPSDAIILEGNPSVRFIQLMLFDQALVFIYGHEIGHIEAGHLARSSMRQLNFAGHLLSVGSPSWTMEYEADRIGQQYAVAFAKGREKEVLGLQLHDLAFAGPAVIFSAFNILETILSIVVSGVRTPMPEVDTHPPAHDRFERLYSAKDCVVFEPSEHSYAQPLWRRLLDLRWRKKETDEGSVEILQRVMKMEEPGSNLASCIWRFSAGLCDGYEETAQASFKAGARPNGLWDQAVAAIIAARSSSHQTMAGPSSGAR